MAPEYGATMGFFPVDEETLDYLRFTNRAADLVALVEAYTKEQGLFRTDATPDPVFADTLELDLATVTPSMAGPKRPQDRVELPDVKKNFHDAFRPEARSGASTAHDATRERRGGDRRHHELHQHLESVGDAGRGTAGEEGRGARPEGRSRG